MSVHNSVGGPVTEGQSHIFADVRIASPGARSLSPDISELSHSPGDIAGPSGPNSSMNSGHPRPGLGYLDMLASAAGTVRAPNLVSADGRQENSTNMLSHPEAHSGPAQAASFSPRVLPGVPSSSGVSTSWQQTNNPSLLGQFPSYPAMFPPYFLPYGAPMPPMPWGMPGHNGQMPVHYAWGMAQPITDSSRNPHQVLPDTSQVRQAALQVNR